MAAQKVHEALVDIGFSTPQVFSKRPSISFEQRVVQLSAE
jgi:hypothetical protein